MKSVFKGDTSQIGYLNAKLKLYSNYLLLCMLTYVQNLRIPTYGPGVSNSRGFSASPMTEKLAFTNPALVEVRNGSCLRLLSPYLLLSFIDGKCTYCQKSGNGDNSGPEIMGTKPSVHQTSWTRQFLSWWRWGFNVVYFLFETSLSTRWLSCCSHFQVMNFGLSRNANGVNNSAEPVMVMKWSYWEMQQGGRLSG